MPILLAVCLLSSCSLFLDDESGSSGQDAGRDATSSSDGPASVDATTTNPDFTMPYSCDEDSLALYHFDAPDQDVGECGPMLGGTPLMTPGQTANNFLEAVAIDGEGDALTLIRDAIDLSASELTIEAWVKPQGQGQAVNEHRFIISHQAMNNTPRFSLALRAAAPMDLSFSVVAVAGCTPAPIEGGNLNIDQWHHVALTISNIDTASVNFALFVDGEQVAGANATGCAETDATVHIGNWDGVPSGATKGFGHAIDELHISKTLRFTN